MKASRTTLTRAKRAGHSYAIETLQSGEFQRWLHDSLVEASRLPPDRVISIDSIADAREVTERTIDDFRKETKRTMGPLEMFDLIDIDPTPPVDWRVATAFYEGLDDALNDPKTVEMLADDIWRMKQRGPGMSEARRGGWNVIATDGGSSEVVSGPYRSRSEAQREARRTRMPGYRIDVAPSGARLSERVRESHESRRPKPRSGLSRYRPTKNWRLHKIVSITQTRGANQVEFSTGFSVVVHSGHGRSDLLYAMKPLDLRHEGRQPGPESRREYQYAALRAVLGDRPADFVIDQDGDVRADLT